MRTTPSTHGASAPCRSSRRSPAPRIWRRGSLAEKRIGIGSWRLGLMRVQRAVRTKHASFRAVDMVSSSSCCLSSFRPPYLAPVQDVFLPYCQDARHPQDTLIFYVEHDFRFHQRDDQAAAQWLPFVAGDGALEVLPRPWEWFPAKEPRARSGKGYAGPVGSRPEGRGRHSNMTKSVRCGTADGGPDAVSDELCDCIAYCNQAARHSIGDFVWLGWNGGPTAPGQRARGPSTRICFGSQLLAVTPRGAAQLEAALRQRGPGHIDLQILECLEATPGLRACSSYVNPPVGGFNSHHASTNIEGHRPGPWHKPWCLGGTNEHNGTSWQSPQQRCIARFQWDVPLVSCSRVALPDVAGLLHWRTRRPPRSPLLLDAKAEAMLNEWGWLDDNGQWLGWAFARGARWWNDPAYKGGGKGQEGGSPLMPDEQLQRLPPTDYWKTLQVAPAGPPALGGVRRSDAPVSALGFELATASEGIPSLVGHNDRAARDERHARAQYLERNFTDVDGQAGPSCWETKIVSACGNVGVLGRPPAEPLACGAVERAGANGRR